MWFQNYVPGRGLVLLAKQTGRGTVPLSYVHQTGEPSVYFAITVFISLRLKHVDRSNTSAATHSGPYLLIRN